ncbi:hypothetical protein Calkro_2337 [Caldicellulosiruptor kronotskyensis 2002]|uniref:Nucleic acid binding OB-fold tRNA/helicase-type n=1 Tax=Caldicellulosiruptor kronotskyensis (strain DSM 18902 / VKM B-2412 / 2002) TaxID=632348 RepID=E4SHD5_CALK2|nr:hypothetical protein [Caldicellulosiruptor kronotskyensis]ADQ47160.1 hypothetical protein Calkro_2337 [Caldicellulosiruptor kronotskyensis 2002]
MARKLFMLLLILIGIEVSYLTETSLAKPIDSNTLINNAFKYDGKFIEFQGEAIGEIMKRGNYAWVNVHDGNNAIGIFLKYEDAKIIKYLGRHGVKGDTVYVKGIFNRACREHGGDLDIHAYQIKILKRGYEIEEKVDKIRLVIGILIFTVGSFLMWTVFRYKW